MLMALMVTLVLVLVLVLVLLLLRHNFSLWLSLVQVVALR